MLSLPLLLFNPHLQPGAEFLLLSRPSVPRAAALWHVCPRSRRHGAVLLLSGDAPVASVCSGAASREGRLADALAAAGLSPSSSVLVRPRPTSSILVLASSPPGLFRRPLTFHTCPFLPSLCLPRSVLVWPSCRLPLWKFRVLFSALLWTLARPPPLSPAPS